MSSSTRGFASFSPDTLHAVARRGGIAAHESGRAHHFTAEEAARAGRLGSRAVSRDRNHMARIGRVGGSRPRTPRPGA